MAAVNQNESIPAASPPFSARQALAALGILIVLAIVIGIRWRLADRPLERDEGEYAYAGQLLLQGVPPYQAAYNMKWPGTYASYAAIMAVFGETDAGIRAGLIVVNVLTALLVFLLARRIMGQLGAVIAAGSFALLSISPATVGLAAHATHFVMLPAVAGLLLLQRPRDHNSPWRVFAAGALFGLATIMKQSGAAFAVFAALWILSNAASTSRQELRGVLGRRLGSLALGGLLPLAIMAALLVHAGVFARFWEWTVKYAGAYAAISGSTGAWLRLKGALAGLASRDPGLWLLSLLGLIPLFVDRAYRPWRFFILALSLCSLLAVCPGWYFRGHYFIQLLPAAGLLAGLAVESAARQLRRRMPAVSATALAALVFASAAGWSLWRSRQLYFVLTPRQACVALYGENPFPESTEIGRFLTVNCPPDARVAVLGSEPQIYFYSRRRSATGYIYTYPLMEPQKFALAMQEEMIREIEKSNPAYVVFVRVNHSWLAHDNSIFLIMDWFEKYRGQHLDLFGLVDITSMWQAEYHWLRPGDPEPKPKSEYSLKIYRNRALTPAPLVLPAGLQNGVRDR